ncbi:MAG: type 1 glutamine amidotransferase [Thiohalocapsa sp.]|jgi:GMP synthase-like glutamine amidotransferase|uniref:type 1 glutamine amidotransferase n=1 Tax=Thiohalocapsa sp. TaxID=2497641 RepID=UPI0025F3D66F|nr:type 1 glutamine amidotransferase [Thiohalocapsa sp.]MCG6941911.1 type 1 glutamine amidotransferase [Thiohalocapsa sp.]
MHIQVLQHVPFEGPAAIADWAGRRGHSLAVSHLYAGDSLPGLTDFDRLIVMGGPMSVGDTDDYPWLADERAFIAQAVAVGKSVIGVCLGAQLIAAALNARVYRNAHKEIGWFPVQLTDEARALDLCDGLPPTLPVFHWHGDTFDLPAGAVHLAQSEGCVNQAFLVDGRVLGLQFHLESTPESVTAICRHCADEIVPARYVQTAAEMRAADPDLFAGIGRTLEMLLDRLPA